MTNVTHRVTNDQNYIGMQNDQNTLQIMHADWVILGGSSLLDRGIALVGKRKHPSG